MSYQIDIIQFILGHIKVGDFGLTRHAGERMLQRGIRRADIIEAAKTSHHEELLDSAKIGFEGLDKEGDPITVIAVWNSGVIIITVIGE